MGNEVGSVGKSGKLMTTREVANALGVSIDVITNCVHRIMPDKFQRGKTTFFNEMECAAISAELKHNPNVADRLSSEVSSEVKNTVAEAEIVANYKAAADALVKMLEIKNQELRQENEKQQAKIAEQGERLDDWTLTAKGKIDRQKLFAKINRLIRERAQIAFNGDYSDAYNWYYAELGGRHCFAHRVNMAWLRKAEVTVLLDFMKKNNNRTDLPTSATVAQARTSLTPALKLMTTKEVAAALGVTPHTITDNAKKCLPNKKIECRRPTFWSEAEVTVLLECLRSNQNNQHNLESTSLNGVQTSLTPALKLKQAFELAQEAYEEELERINAENARLAQSEESLKIALDESREWYSVKRMQALNPTVNFSWRLLKEASARRGLPIKKVFDANYGEVNAYHRKVFEDLYFDALEYGD